jgi:hypothetical protein
MPIINTNDYNVYLDISDDFNVELTTFTSKDMSNLDQFIDNFSVPDEESILILWGAVNRIIFDSTSISKLNKFYHSIKNPLVVFTGVLNAPNIAGIDFCYQSINLFQHISKISQPQNRLIVFKKSKKYLFMSTKDYLSRRYILQHLLNNGFENQGIIAYKCLQKLFIEPFGDNIKYIKDACESIDTQIPIIGFDGPSYNYEQVPDGIINDTYLSIITETYYQGPIYFSEKIYYAMLYNHFFIYLGPPHSLKYLRSLGFKTFGHIVDERYDDIEDHAERLFAVTKSMDEFISKPLSEIEQLYVKI